MSTASDKRRAALNSEFLPVLEYLCTYIYSDSQEVEPEISDGEEDKTGSSKAPNGKSNSRSNGKRSK